MALREERVYSGYYTFICITMMLISLCRVYTYAEDNETKNVLILNSYQKALSWTDGQTDGIISILRDSGIKYTAAVEYMDWKNYPTNENLEHLYSCLKYKYSTKDIDIIITTDDAALEFALKNREELFSNAPIVFSGVNKKGVGEITYGYSNFTGVTEEVDPEGTIQAALDINPDIKEIYVIFDETESGLSTGELTIQAIHKIAPGVKAVPLNKGIYTDIIKQVRQIQKESIILVTTYYMDSEGTVIGFENFSRMVSQNSYVPVFHLYDFGMGYGTVGGSMLSGRHQGECAGIIAVRILKGESVSQIPVNTSKTTQYVFDYEQLRRLNIPLGRLPRGSLLINKPFSLFEAYKNLIITVMIVFLLLIMFISILIFYLKKISKMKQELYHSHTELAQLYDELTASDEELKQQFDELTQVQESLMSSERRYSLLYGKMLNGFFVFEPVFNSDNKLADIRFLDVNPAFENQTNINAKDIVGKTWKQMFGFPNQDLSIYQKVITSGETERFETYYSEVNTYYLVNAFKLSDLQVGVVFDNISEYKMAIKEIKSLNEELEQRVDERTSELQAAINELEAFTYTVSHDLKSPLRAVDGYGRIMFEDYSEKLGKEAKEILHNVRGISRDMLEMIDKLLQYSTTSRALIYKEEINIREMFVSIFSELKLANPNRDIRLKIETVLPSVFADRILLKQVIYNILSNAVKFTKHRKQGLVIVGNTLTEDEYVFYVKDNGAGFDMEYSAKLFGIFQRLHTSNEFEGTGIGLVTVKKIIQRHGGRTWIEGKVDTGATVYFTLPFSW